MRYSLRLLLLAVAAVVLIVMSAFFTDWFVIHVGGLSDVQIDLRRVRICEPQCYAHDVSTLSGMYPSLATLAFWSAMPLFVVIATQAGAKLLSGFAYQVLAKIGTGLGAVTFFSAFGAGFLVGPEDASIAGFQMFTVERGWGPLCMVLGALAGVIAVRYAMIDGTDEDAGEYKPVVVPKIGDSKDGTTRLPVTPLSVNKIPTPAAGAGPALRNKAPSQAPEPARSRADSEGGGRTRAPSQSLEPVRTKAPSQSLEPVRTKAPSQSLEPVRTKPPSEPPLDMPARARTSSSGPVDVSARIAGAPADAIHPPPEPPRTGGLDIAARLAAAPVEVAIRPPLPEPAPVPGDQIPVAPESGLVIRKRSPSTAPIENELPLPPEIGITVRTKAPSVAPPMMASVASALGVAAPSEPAPVTPQPAGFGPAPAAPARSTEPPPLQESDSAIAEPIPKMDSIPMPKIEAKRPDMKSASNPAIRPPPDARPRGVVTVPPAAPKSTATIAVSGKINYAVTSATISGEGINATRDDGLSKLIKWGDIVGIVARRLPQPAPFDGLTFVDIVSSAGSTMRILPKTAITGHTLTGDHTERARSLVSLLAAAALDAKLDSATKVFANGTSKAAQLRDEQTLATHDARLA